MSHGPKPRSAYIPLDQFSAERAFSVNLLLSVQPSNAETPNYEINLLQDGFQKLKNMILVDPEDAATIPIIVEKISVQNEQIKSLKGAVGDLN